jgi:hypothetical protein
MTYIPKIARELKTFSTVEEMNVHMNLYYQSFMGFLTKSTGVVFHIIKKYACRVAGVCWLKQEKLASLAEVSMKTVERAVQFLKERGVLKIYHTKRSNGLNGNCYYVLQPFQGELAMDDEEIVSVEENVGAEECVRTYETTDVVATLTSDKLFKSSESLENSFETKKEEEIYNNAHVTKEEYQDLIQFLTNQKFTEKIATEITNRVLSSSVPIQPTFLLKYYAAALDKFQRRLSYKEEPIISVVDYFVKLVMKETEPEDAIVRETKSTKERESDLAGQIGLQDMLCEKRRNGRRMVDFYSVK